MRKRILLIALISTLMIASVVAASYVVILGVKSVDRGQTQVDIEFYDGTNYTIKKMLFAEGNGNNQYTKKILLIQGDLDGVRICGMKDNQRKCLK